MFYEIAGELFRMLLNDANGAWLISYDNPRAPFFVAASQLITYKKVTAPKEYLYISGQDYSMTGAEYQRLELIKPLIENDEAIIDRKYRAELADEIASKNNTTQRRIMKVFFKYLAGRCLIEKKEMKPEKIDVYEDFKWAINQFYFSAKKMSLKDAYDAMLLKRYMTEDGKLKENIPTWTSFKYYYYDRGYHMKNRKMIARDGLSNYQRNERPLTGSAMKWKNKIGTYQMDATTADIYLVSRFDRSEIIGRPNIYLAVDTATQLIAGIYVGLDSGDSAVMACLANTATNKVEYCKKYGIEITKDQWPSEGLPSEVITDKGRDFMSSRVLELTKRYRIQFEALPPFRPDGKGLVEKTFDLLQQRYKSHLRGKGVIEPDAQERWATDYRRQAVLDMNEFTKIMILCVLHLNSRQILNNYMLSQDMMSAGIKPISSSIWNWYSMCNLDMTIPISELEIKQLILKREEVSFTRKGIRYNKLLYIHEDMERMFEQIGVGKKVIIGYDNEDTSYIYLIEDGEYIQFRLSPPYEPYCGISMMEYKMFEQKNLKIKKELERQELESRIEVAGSIQSIIKNAEQTEKEKQSGSDIKRNRDNERNRLS